jgi:hypothetical protein
MGSVDAGDRLEQTFVDFGLVDAERSTATDAVAGDRAVGDASADGAGVDTEPLRGRPDRLVLTD